MWFVNNGVVRDDPATDTWAQWAYGNVFMSVQPKPAGGYLVWSSSRSPFRDYTFVFDSDTQEWTIIDVRYPFDEPGEVVGMPGKDCVDESGNFWALRSTMPGDYDSLDYRRPDGTWVEPPEPYDGVTFDLGAFKAYGHGRALLVDGSGGVYQFDGSAWTSRGQWGGGAFAYSTDIDAAGNIWVCGVGGAARRDAETGRWQRYRVTNTSNYDDFNRDLTIDSVNGDVYAGANAASGVGGMVRFDGVRWTGWNQATYGLGYDWPFPNDYCHALAYRPSNGHVAVSPLNWLYGVHEWTGAGFVHLPGLDGAQRMCEDSWGRVWAIGEYFSLSYYDGNQWSSMPIVGWGAKIQEDPARPGTVWAGTDYEILRTDGTYAFRCDRGLPRRRDVVHRPGRRRRRHRLDRDLDAVHEHRQHADPHRREHRRVRDVRARSRLAVPRRARPSAGRHARRAAVDAVRQRVSVERGRAVLVRRDECRRVPGTARRRAAVGRPAALVDR